MEQKLQMGYTNWLDIENKLHDSNDGGKRG